MGSADIKKRKAVWNKECDQCSKDQKVHNENKGKVFIITCGHCAKEMKNQNEKSSTFTAIDEKNNVIELLKAIEQQTRFLQKLARVMATGDPGESSE